MGNKKAFLFWYKMDVEAITEYVYVIATSIKQAKYFWFKYLREDLGAVYDYDAMPVDIINQKDFVKPHKVGEILGECAII